MADARRVSGPAAAVAAVLTVVFLIVAGGYLGTYLTVEIEGSPMATPSRTAVLMAPASDPNRVDDAEVGDCVDYRIDFRRATRAGCGTDEALYRVAVIGGPGGCPDGDYQRYPIVDRSSRNAVLCLILNARTGQCFSDFAAASGREARAACGPGAARVTRVIEQTADRGACGGEPALVYSRPPTTLCAIPL